MRDGQQIGEEGSRLGHIVCGLRNQGFKLVEFDFGRIVGGDATQVTQVQESDLCGPKANNDGDYTDYTGYTGQKSASKNDAESDEENESHDISPVGPVGPVRANDDGGSELHRSYTGSPDTCVKESF